MSIKSDKWISEMSKNKKMIEPFSENQVRIDEKGDKLISYGVSSYGYDVRCSNEFKVFTNIHSAIVDPKSFEFQHYTEQDNILISSSRLDTAFTSSTDYIEYYAYDENKNLIYPTSPNIQAVSVNSYSVINGDVCLYPSKDLENIGYDYGSYYSTYNFYRKLLNSDISNY